MFKLQILLCFIITLCTCHYKGGYSKVEWNSTNEKFIDKDISLGEELISVEFVKCKKKRKNLYLSGKIFDSKNLINGGDLSEKVMIFEIDSKGTVKDTLGISDLKGNFDIETIKAKNKFLVFKQISKKWGVKYRNHKFK
ncbi:hypothetical protein [Tenacibaculum finnmarkense]|uniref:hypothetical protein n=1 Tax=Tenacibaculum finnmarkense TaxID=2781243 RepID=UPI001EFBF76D|nr:hypothetical protein [Tenacibaculum finnmarkense]MCG8208209.1 hypothetical protein [Tenacibaculum finnmarkense genomovar finnmarkense]MCG8724245.1 hypothetical protein [Tenacibaculum finnmarkense]MCG8742501.1 hypothetical protein [Tenacibaculum finnmarkense]MCG8765901.1 hypothetical protein [Tenacibaculum finnmarkense]MCG8778966.1 hypothetical protein [Tenacibaculum finnmarkense]